MGAPKGNSNAASRSTLLWRRAITEALANQSGVPEDKGFEERALVTLGRIATRVVELAEGGDFDAIQEIANRMDGKPKQQVELGGQDGAPVSLQVTLVKPRSDE